MPKPHAPFQAGHGGIQGRIGRSQDDFRFQRKYWRSHLNLNPSQAILYRARNFDSRQVRMFLLTAPRLGSDLRRGR